MPIPIMWLPKPMLDNTWVRAVIKAGSVEKYVDAEWKKMERKKMDLSHLKKEDNITFVNRLFDYIRCTHDFPYWAACYDYIENKDGGAYILFRLSYPQRLLISVMEEQRVHGDPIRITVLKARQLGGSTAIQLYMQWLQDTVCYGLNALIAAQVKRTASVIENMYMRVIDRLPTEMLYTPGTVIDPKVPKTKGDRHSENIHHIPARSCCIQIGTAQEPDSLRGSNFALVHCSEVAFWPNTPNNNPEKLIRDIEGTVQFKPNTLIAYESTANGMNDWFYNQYQASKDGRNAFRNVFIPWQKIERYMMGFKAETLEDLRRIDAKDDGWNKVGQCPSTRKEFAHWLIENKESRNVNDDQHEPGIYLWRLFDLGATLEGIYWYIHKRTAFHDHADMAAEFPSDDIEAFKNSGANVFDTYHIDRFRPACRPPQMIGDVYGDAVPNVLEHDKNAACLQNVRFVEDHQGQLWIWDHPEIYDDVKVTNRYLVSVDVGGRGNKADWSVICVFDRLPMADGCRPEVVAQWRGHIDHDLLAWKAAQIAKYYDNALLVIESNTLETRSRENGLDGDQANFILNVLKRCYSNLYGRKVKDDAKHDADEPVRYGFHTNVSTKPVIISGLVIYVREQMYVERDIRVLDEYNTYVRESNGAYNAADGKHDDLLMTRAIGLHICFNEMPLPQVIDVTKIEKPKIAGAINEATM